MSKKMINLELNISETTLNQTAQSLLIFDERAFIRAINRATKKIALWLQVHISREIGHLLGIKVSGFKKFRFKIKAGDASKGEPTFLWVGKAPIKAHYFKNPRWKRTWAGAKSGGRTYVGSFIGNANGPKIFRRIPGQKTKNLKDKLEIVTVEVDEVIEKVTQRIVKRANQRYQTLLEQEINYELNQIKAKR